MIAAFCPGAVIFLVLMYLANAFCNWLGQRERDEIARREERDK
jgi:hypothetical protein